MSHWGNNFVQGLKYLGLSVPKTINCLRNKRQKSDSRNVYPVLKDLMLGPDWNIFIHTAELQLIKFLSDLSSLSLNQLESDWMSPLSVFRYPKLMTLKQSFFLFINLFKYLSWNVLIVFIVSVCHTNVNNSEMLWPEQVETCSACWTDIKNNYFNRNMNILLHLSEQNFTPL